jgi:hypothetical protein
MHCVFPRIFFILFCIQFSKGWCATADVKSPIPREEEVSGEKHRSRVSTASSVGIDDEGAADASCEKPLGQRVKEIRDVFVAWIKSNSIPLPSLITLDDSKVFGILKRRLAGSNDVMAKASLVSSGFPLPTDEVIDAFRRYYALPVIPLFSTMFGGSLDMIHGEMPNEEVERILRDYSYE